MDRITKSLLDEFVEQQSLQRLAEDKAFEHFAAYLTTASHYSESFSSDDLSVGAGSDCGIDAIAVIVNGTLITEPEEVSDLADTNGYLDVLFVLVQAERSSGFETAKIGQFSFGVTDFFADKPSLPQNERIRHYAKIVKRIYDLSRYFKKGNPQCQLYYVTTGKWVDDTNLCARKNAAVADLQSAAIFRHVCFDCIDAERLHALYRASQNAISAEIVFSERTVIPEIPGVEQAYLGLVTAPQFLKLIENDKGEIQSLLFYDNVRHWQEWNTVNAEIRETLLNKEASRYFPLLNNGVTIVAQRILPTANKFLVEDYQVVNGCQTSFVLHECRQSIDDTVMIPIRLIATTNDDIKNRIIKATNRQTEVTEDQLFALSDFPKRLEAFFPTFEGKKRLYYERRSRQYNGVPGIEKVRVINMTSLVRAFAAIFQKLPHRTTRNYRNLLKGVGKDIFEKSHQLEPYYLAAYAHYRLEFLFRNQTLESELKPARYHLLLAYQLLTTREAVPRLNSHDATKYCTKVLETLWNDELSISRFEKAAEIVRKVADGNLHRDNIRTEPFTESLLNELNAK